MTAPEFKRGILICSAHRAEPGLQGVYSELPAAATSDSSTKISNIRCVQIAPNLLTCAQGFQLDNSIDTSTLPPKAAKENNLHQSEMEVENVFILCCQHKSRRSVG